MILATFGISALQYLKASPLQAARCSGVPWANPAEDEATIKRLHFEDGRVVLIPENPAMKPLPMPEGRIVGKVVAVLRRL